MNVNRPEVSSALAQFYGVKGNVPITADSVLLPVAITGDITDTPYLDYGIPVGEQGSADAVALENAVVVIRPGQQVILQLMSFILDNDGAGARIYQPTFMTPAQISTAGLTGQGNVTDLKHVFDPDAAVIRKRSSNFLQGSHTAMLGDSFGIVRVPAGSSFLWTLPKPGIFLYGQGAGQAVPALAFWNVTVNEAARVWYYGKEWPLPG